MPPVILANAGRSLNVEIEVFNHVDAHPSRRFTLKEPFYQIKVGRGSQNGGKELLPADLNAWFESRVMSRAHAILQADPITKNVYIEDVGSMHGTYVEERKLEPHTRERLISGDCLRFGAEVTRGPGTCWINDEPTPHCCSQPIRWLPLSAKGDFFSTLSESNPVPESFPPLEMYISFHWTDEAPQSVPNAPTMVHAEIPRNSFSVPEYDDDDDEIEIIHESVRAPRVEVVVPSRQYTVPESDLSCAGSFTSDDSSSEPPTPSPRNYRTVVAPWKQVSEKIKETSQEDVATSPATARERLTALSDAPSAAGFFHFSSEQPPAYHQALSQTKFADERGDVPIMISSLHAAEDAMDDEDLTESDVEFADGSSDDLFDDDDDGESAQQGLIAESPPVSVSDDSDEEPLASNRGMKLAGSNTYTEVLHPSGVTGEDDTRAPAAERGPGESPLFDALYSQNPTTVMQNFVPKPSNSMNDARAPSPSDAAMAKTTTAQLPPIESPVQVQSPFLASMTSDFPRLSTTEAPYARSIWSAWPEYTADLPSEYAPPVFPHFNSTFLYQEGPFAYRQPGEFMNADDSSDRGAEESSTHQKDTFKKPDEPVDSTRVSTYPFASATSPDGEQHANLLAPTGLRATRLSIDDIVEKNTREESSQKSGPKLKRKADDMSANEDTLATSLASSDPQAISELGLASQVTEPTESALPRTVTLPTIEAELVAASPTTDAIEQPARKRAKIGVAKYAAAVFAGVVAGGVGTMAALLALPPIQLSLN